MRNTYIYIIGTLDIFRISPGFSFLHSNERKQGGGEKGEERRQKGEERSEGRDRGEGMDRRGGRERDRSEERERERDQEREGTKREEERG
jgi:hypothetical protein